MDLGLNWLRKEEEDEDMREFAEYFNFNLRLVLFVKKIFDFIFYSKGIIMDCIR